MLVEDKFIIIQIPRCATSSFLKSCILSGIKTKNIRSHGYKNLFYTGEEASGGIHFHESIDSLQEYFGYNYPVIAIKRDGLESFISFWKHTIKMFSSFGYTDVADKMSKMTGDEIFFFDGNDYDLMNFKNIESLGIELRNRIGGRSKDIPIDFFFQLFLPKEWFHRNNPGVIWFDFKKLGDLEKWVSLELNLDFKLEHENSSSDVKCFIEKNEEIKKKYDEIYSKYKEFKKLKTLI